MTDSVVRKKAQQESIAADKLNYKINVKYMILYYLYCSGEAGSNNLDIVYPYYRLGPGNGHLGLAGLGGDLKNYNNNSKIFNGINLDNPWDVMNAIPGSAGEQDTSEDFYKAMHEIFGHRYSCDYPESYKNEILEPSFRATIDQFIKGSISLDQAKEILQKQLSEADSLFGDQCHCGCSEEKPDEPRPQDVFPGSVSDNNSPIVLDLDRDGVETVGFEEGVYFDHDGNRFAEQSGWRGADDALLIRDLNHNGQVDGGSELFGNNTLLANGKKAANGFEALAELDSNRDGIVDKNDESWSELKLWQDKKGNGVVEAGEILSLEEAGVAGLNIGYTNQSVIDENGNEHKQAGNFIRKDGSKGQMTDVWFKTDLVDTQFMDEIEVSDDIAGLPNLRGYGNMPSLHQAMALT